jgi:hypothetical protein
MNAKVYDLSYAHLMLLLMGNYINIVNNYGKGFNFFYILT